jgi:hypothetical protein
VLVLPGKAANVRLYLLPSEALSEAFVYATFEVAIEKR